jgi:N-acetylglucosaminyl-diphospho-decaprenol L-rhamnosyltransferase
VISVSLVSHGHGAMVWRLVDQILACSEVTQIIVTLNIPEAVPKDLSSKVFLVKNQSPKGFGANHNAAFALANGDYYCVINPDIELVQNPFRDLLSAFSDRYIGLVAPRVMGSDGLPEDSMRYFLTPWSMVRRVLGLDSGSYSFCEFVSTAPLDWVAGMFMLFKADIYAEVGGFDEQYFMYCEDADICTRLWKSGYKVFGCLLVSVTHNARRASHWNFKHFFWHLRSMTRYLLRYLFSLPKRN